MALDVARRAGCHLSILPHRCAQPPGPGTAPCQGLVVSTFAIKENEGDEGQRRALLIISKRNKPSESLNATEPCFGEAGLQGPPAQGSRLLPEHLPSPEAPGLLVS